MKQETKYVRRGRTIYSVDTNQVETFESINAAKRKSRELQGDDLGRGILIKDSK